MLFESIKEAVMSVPGMLGINYLIAIPLSVWLSKVWARRILEKDKARYSKEVEDFKQNANKEIEAMKTKLNLKLYMSQQGFNTEYSIYKELWDAIVDLHKINFSLIPNPALSEDDYEKYEKYLKTNATTNHEKAIIKVQYIYEKHRPFFPEPIYENTVEVTHLCHEIQKLLKESILISSDLGFIQTCIEIHQKLGKSIEVLCSSIRNRLEKMIVLDGN